LFLKIPTHELTPVDIPDLDRNFGETWHELALSFPGYACFYDCAERANHALRRWEAGGRPSGSLDEMRGWLFFEQRRSNHFGETHDLDYIAFLVESIRVWVEAGEANSSRQWLSSCHAGSWETPASARGARERRWPWSRFSVGERFAMRLVSLAPPSAGPTALGDRAGRPHVLLKPPVLMGRRGYWDVMPFIDEEERSVFVARELERRSWET
jgi:hypothetical protein